MASTQKILEIDEIDEIAFDRIDRSRSGLGPFRRLPGGLTLHRVTGVSVIDIHFPRTTPQDGKPGRDLVLMVVEDDAVKQLREMLEWEQFMELRLRLSEFAIGHTEPDTVHSFPRADLLAMKSVALGGYVHAGVPLGAKLWDLTFRIIDGESPPYQATSAREAGNRRLSRFRKSWMFRSRR